MRIIVSLVRPISRCDGGRHDVRYWPIADATFVSFRVRFPGVKRTSQIEAAMSTKTQSGQAS